MTRLIYVTHPDVVKDPDVPVPRWALSERGRARMAAMLSRSWVPAIGAIYSSDEQKSLDGAAILSEHVGLTPVAIPALGEIDRSSTGFLPDAEHAALSRACFEHPTVSASGWETAEHAQNRVASAVTELVTGDTASGDIALIGHGGVGTLLLCSLTGRAICLAERPPGADGGYFFIYDLDAGELLQEWERIDDPPVPE